MTIRCVICSMARPRLEDVKDAEYVANGHGVCFEHVDAVSAEPGAISVTINKPVES